MEIASNSTNDQGDFFENQISTTKLGAFTGISSRPINIAQPLVNSSVTIEFQNISNATVRIENLLQEVQEQKTYSSLSGMHTFVTADYAPGVYFVYVSADGVEVRNKFIKVDEIEDAAVALTGIQLSHDNVELNLGETLKLTATPVPATAQLPQLYWRSSNPDAITVDENGLVHAIGGGQATIEVSNEDFSINASAEVLTRATVLSVSTGALDSPTEIEITTTATTAILTWKPGNNSTYHSIGYRLEPNAWVNDYYIPNEGTYRYTMENLEPNSTYALRIRSHNGTSSKPWVNTTFTTKTIDHKSFQIREEGTAVRTYPNPTVDVLYIEGLQQESLVKVYSINGAMVKQKQIQDRLDVSELERGIYILKIENISPIRIVKQ